MEDGLATGGPPSAPREHGWRRLLLALAAFLSLPRAVAVGWLLAPILVLVPIDDTLTLLTPVLAACFVVGWSRGGSLVLAVIWAALAAWLILAAGGSASAYQDLTRGWALLLAAMFGVVSVVSPTRRFFPRALSAVGSALLLGLLLLAGRGQSPQQVTRTLAEQYSERGTRYQRWVNSNLLEPTQADTSARVAEEKKEARVRFDELMRQVAELAQGSVRLYPALLAIESLVALTLAWALYHRLSRARLGPPLAALRDFRFSDQLIWGLVVGLVLALLPRLVSLRPIGINVLVFFGALYAVRGLGVAVWFLPRERGPASLLGAVAIALLTFISGGGFLAGMGVFDTWINWRARPRQSS